ncbi:hypothetical protein [Chryseobacterium jejuense]|uniref:Uncharacterized protein n=1 Tax=Chryseobacterium jejuense TaxID=445960 RepID=A0A2X2X2L1_CHRJE|nr:hypothetical protein [Chryseobacterium jejuense]SDJ57259.1 hypothetical protein SAMN05421542_3849 [Chryseobacterium jejuense]SQB46157.1 Uncharacterised protein [Chryseobacterium jejuense]
MSNKQLFHIIWTTHHEYPVWDKNGNWQKLVNAYTELQKYTISCYLSHVLPIRYVNKSSKNELLLLNEKSINQLKIDIEKLCRKNGDRIIDGLEIKMLRINESKVEILAFSPAVSILQKISRLKSKTSSLLGTKYPEEFPENKIWGKGFWYSNILNKEDLAVSIIKNHN